MTYCLAMKLADGLVFLSDSRTNAGVDHIATFRKMYRFGVAGESALVILSAGNLGTTQQVMQQLRYSAGEAWWQLHDMHQMAAHIGQLLHEEINAHESTDSVDFRAHFLFGGQIKGQSMELFHIYPEGNFIAATQETPYFQIGESKYGKPILDRIIRYDTDLDTAVRCALISMDSTIRSNLSVGLPLDLLQYQKDSLHNREHTDICEDHEAFQQLRRAWAQGIQNAFEQMPTANFFANNKSVLDNNTIQLSCKKTQ